MSGRMRAAFAPALVLALAAFGAGPVRAQQAAPAPAGNQGAILEPQMQGTVAYISGGIGDDELQNIRAVQDNYNLRLTFAEHKTGTAPGTAAYLADIPVRIIDQKGTVSLDASSQGPIMLVSLAPGSYRITATYHGNSQTRSVSVPAKGTASTVFYWPQS